MNIIHEKGNEPQGLHSLRPDDRTEWNPINPQNNPPPHPIIKYGGDRKLCPRRVPQRIANISISSWCDTPAEIVDYKGSKDIDILFRENLKMGVVT